MSFYFLESTALAKLFVQEAGSEELIALIEPLSSAQKLVSALGLTQVYAALRRRQRSSGLHSAAVNEVLQLLVAEFAQMTERPLSSAVTDKTMQLLDVFPLRHDDAVQLASCIVARSVSGVTDFVFVTTNPSLLQAARAEGLQTLNPEEA